MQSFSAAEVIDCRDGTRGLLARNAAENTTLRRYRIREKCQTRMDFPQRKSRRFSDESEYPARPSMRRFHVWHQRKRRGRGGYEPISRSAGLSHRCGRRFNDRESFRVHSARVSTQCLRDHFAIDLRDRRCGMSRPSGGGFCPSVVAPGPAFPVGDRSGPADGAYGLRE